VNAEKKKKNHTLEISKGRETLFKKKEMGRNGKVCKLGFSKRRIEGKGNGKAIGR